MVVGQHGQVEIKRQLTERPDRLTHIRNELLHIRQILILRILHIVERADQARHRQGRPLAVHPDPFVCVVLRDQHGGHVPCAGDCLRLLSLIQRVDDRLEKIVAVRVLRVEKVNGDDLISETLQIVAARAVQLAFHVHGNDALARQCGQADGRKDEVPCLTGSGRADDQTVRIFRGIVDALAISCLTDDQSAAPEVMQIGHCLH